MAGVWVGLHKGRSAGGERVLYNKTLLN